MAEIERANASSADDSPAGYLPPTDWLDAVFPFHLILDSDLRVTHAGPALVRAVGIDIGEAFGARFRMLNPSTPVSWGSLAGAVDDFLLIQERRLGLKLRGQLNQIPALERLLFLGGPWLADPDELHRYNLRIKDFALHDPTIDLMHAHQVSKNAATDAERAVLKLRRRSDEVRLANEQLKSLSEQLAERRALLAELGQIHKAFIAEQGSSQAIERLLALLLEQTQSTWGFIGTASTTPEGRVRFNKEAQLVAPNESIEGLVPSANHLSGELALAAQRVLEDDTVLKNDGLSPGTRSMLMLPVSHQGDRLGLIGLFDRPGGYDEAIVDTIEPVISSFATLARAHGLRAQKDIAVAKVETQSAIIATKDTLIQEIHHRVKNNLQIVSSLLSLQMASNNTVPATVEQLKVAHTRVASIATLHELIYSSSDLQSISLVALIQHLLAAYSQIYREVWSRIKTSTRVPATIAVLEDQAGPIALILNELITNAGKHAFPNGRQGNIVVSADVSRDSGGATLLKLVIEDDGLGFVADDNPGVSTGLGMRIIQRLCKQLDARLFWESPASGGTRCLLDIPLKELRHDAPAVTSVLTGGR